jgi:hypothetical protein
LSICCSGFDSPWSRMKKIWIHKWRGTNYELFFSTGGDVCRFHFEFGKLIVMLIK